MWNICADIILHAKKGLQTKVAKKILFACRGDSKSINIDVDSYSAYSVIRPKFDINQIKNVKVVKISLAYCSILIIP